MDYITPFLLETVHCRGAITHLKVAPHAIIERHNYPQLINHLLAQMCALAAVMSASMKEEGILTLQIKAYGPIKMLVVDITNLGHLRGWAQFDSEDKILQTLTMPALEELFPKGVMLFSLDHEGDAPLYQGVVELIGQTLADAVNHYFKQSEQLLANLTIAAGLNEKNQWEAAGLMVQKMPNPDASDHQSHFADVLAYSRTLTDREMLDTALSDEDLLFRLFHETTVRVFDKRDVFFQCRCSRERLHNVLARVSPGELEHYFKAGIIEGCCEFCNQRYDFTKDDFIIETHKGADHD